MAFTSSNATDDLPDTNMSTRTAIDYELAGRYPSQTFKDLRSASKARRRHKANLEKYYSYRSVNAGQVGRPHRQFPTDICADRIFASEAPTITMTKQTLYREAQRYPRPPAYHRRPRELAHWTKTCRKDKERHARRHATQRLRDDAEESLEPYFVAYVAGHGQDPEERDLDDHVFRRCDVCWDELQDYYVANQMFDCNGEAVGQYEDRWDVGLEGVEEGERFGLAGRAKVGALFLMGTEDWRVQPVRWSGNPEYYDDWENGRAQLGYESGCEAETWSWSDVLSLKDGHCGVEADWEVLSSCSSWSHVSV